MFLFRSKCNNKLQVQSIDAEAPSASSMAASKALCRYYEGIALARGLKALIPVALAPNTVAA